MTIQTINIGALANDGTGDDLRAAFLKVNEITDGTTFKIFGGTGISTSASGDFVTINNDTGSVDFENNFDFGAISQDVLSHRDYLQYVVDIDYGTVLAPIASTNLGSI